MRIEYVANGSQREVRDSVGEALVARKIARPVSQTREVVAEEVSERTGKPKRRYKRRDMTAEG